MPSDIQNHTCGYFCEGNRHAVEAIARPDISADQVREGYEWYARQHGWRTFSIRPAPEADVKAWKQKIGWHWDATLKRRIEGPGVFPDTVVCWLVMIERVSDGEVTE